MNYNFFISPVYPISSQKEDIKVSFSHDITKAYIWNTSLFFMMKKIVIVLLFSFISLFAFEELNVDNFDEKIKGKKVVVDFLKRINS